MNRSDFYDEDEYYEYLWTRQLLAATSDEPCEECRWEVVRTGGVVGACDYHRSHPDG